ncbi:helix-turn-helix transcriptional regulator [Clostridium paraputrificum]|uniref:helix-turn-helix domain-containing protein n=1 Tax=Clostridium TaxID=1485 RepID=UPI0006C53A98|nr:MULTISPECIES: helix-turn-helix transcriptional regulator [Clostridium]MDB2089394.1 helix-turn-helix transcriptional regulator [Clostridium paraputrificum]MDB2096330.1 helix-turn-helix transcriptional regulator [Clostridium paraputrificum]MDU1179999.1 helix-turn-helix transcriptional regulator [Clostridium sp.]MDU1226943.1 helix-turn-helix transcriptional regulator [Clostridium sp.]MDU7653128.1 helix-turn-helix transcriptional regulator [Clostridium sp.]
MFNRDKLLFEINKKGWSRYRLSKESNVAQTTLRDIFGEKKVTPSTKTLEKLASALEVPISAFFDDEDINYKSSKEEEEFNSDIVRIERARRKMPKDEQENMMKVLEAAFAKYFND